MANRKAKPAWLWYAGVGRWRRGGKWASKPKARELRRDKRGGYLDAAGKRVPRHAVDEGRKPALQARPSPKKKAPAKKKPAPKKKAPAKKKAAPRKIPKSRPLSDFVGPREWVWTGQGKRWRVDGRFGPAPRAADLRRDDMGRLVDSRGVRVPVGAVRDSPVREVRPARKRVERIRAGTTIVEKEFISSSFRNKYPPQNLGEVLTSLIQRHAEKGPFQADDVVIYEHGIKMVGPERLSPTMMEALAESVEEGIKLKFADTKAGTEVYVYLGNDPKIGGQTPLSFDAQEEAIRRIYDQLLDYWGEADWYLWFEADESLYD